MNRWRSPTGEAIFRKTAGLSVRSAGTARGAKKTLSASDILWADVIFVMEEKHKARMRSQYRDAVHGKVLHVLDIPDDYEFMNPELIDLMREKVEPLIGFR